jgi:hypothetical protein
MDVVDRIDSHYADLDDGPRKQRGRDNPDGDPGDSDDL